MKKNEMVQALQTKANASPSANAVFHVWAVRKRARHSVTLGALIQRMVANKFDFPASEYVDLLKFLADLGFGKLQTDSKGRVIALKEVTVTLQSIGLAALEARADFKEFKAFKPRNRYTELVYKKRQEDQATEQRSSLPKTPVSLIVFINNKEVAIPVPNSLDATEVAELVGKFQEAHPA